LEEENTSGTSIKKLIPMRNDPLKASISLRIFGLSDLKIKIREPLPITVKNKTRYSNTIWQIISF
jgi:hypothetical protein